jgi:hypothetical protein
MSDVAELLATGHERGHLATSRLRVVLVLWPPHEHREWLSLGTLRGHRVEYVVEGGDALVRVGDWISGGTRLVTDELGEMIARADAAAH